MNISESLETIVWDKILKFFDADPNPGKFLMPINDEHTLSSAWLIPDADFYPSRIPDPGAKRHRIPDPRSGSATL
jgi:hypothetical protein